MKILIVGCGRLGGRLASDFINQGHEVSVIDRDSRSFRHLPDDFPGEMVLGTGIDEDVLRTAGIETADIFVAVTEEDNTNIMASQIARIVYQIPRIVLRIYDPVRADIYRDLGLDVVCPTITVAGMIEAHVLGKHAAGLPR